ncbi:hypothetical protein ACFVJ5_17835 [Nocardia sp. NPDC127606]|uniref:hypothetical protein n=1 Tax=Nocardia sp. NPDC127606 TaxID=3345406 RepID=UPI0036309584
MPIVIVVTIACAVLGALSLFGATVAETRANRALHDSRSSFVGDGNPTSSFFAHRARHDRLHRLNTRLLILSAVVSLAATGFAVYAVAIL